MPNRNCDFCNNNYKTNPGAGFYKVTVHMREALQLNTSQSDFICGEHFMTDCFEPSGKLRAGSLPTFFPRVECLRHDHVYSKNCVEEELDIQGVSKKSGILKSALFLGLLWPKPNFFWYFQYPIGYNNFLDDNRIYKTSLINIFYKFSFLTSRISRIIMINYHH